MTMQLLQDYVFTTKYPKFLPEFARRESYAETTKRMMDTHRVKYADLMPRLEKHVDFAEQMVLARRVLGSQRIFQFGGTPVLRKNARAYNCVVSYCDRPEFFQEALWLLLCGTGVGFSVQKHHVAKLPDIFAPIGPEVEYRVPDTIEGWGDSLGVLLSTYFSNDQPFPEFANKRVKFNFDDIRVRGSLLSSGSGRAPGPKPLKDALDFIRNLLDRCARTQRRLRPIDCYDIVMHAGNAVMAGGVRRTATLCMFSFDDEEMLNAKCGPTWYDDNPQRERSNNSAVLLRGAITREQFERVIESTKKWGEPGYAWVDSLEIVFNPCFEIGMYPVWIPTGKSGWQFCNLSTQNMARVKTMDDWRETARAAAILGTLQAGYTKFDYLGETSELITRNEALLGVSMTGMMDCYDLAFDPERQREMAKYVLDVNEEIAHIMNINVAARATAVKPEGTGSLILGPVASGINPWYGKKFFRLAQAGNMELPLQYFKEHNPRAVEPMHRSANGTDSVIVFACEAPEGSKTKADVSGLELLKLVQSTQKNWVNAGKRPERCAMPWLSHNTSNTIHVKENEWNEIGRYIYDNRQDFAGVSLISEEFGELDFTQPPYCSVWEPGKILEVYGQGAIMASGLIVDGMKAFDEDLWLACRHALGESTERLYSPQKDWVRRAIQFAERYFNGNVREMSYCLKRVHLFKKWMDLNREYKPVDYRSMFETEDVTDRAGAAACVGGKCEII